ncbi:hypothetical protein ACG74X_13725 [Marivita sp. S0852]|uniref:hypothetical protein n=1 Tax=Marivita sp. S0852 TaxID=3373893 RepID=UPI003982618B
MLRITAVFAALLAIGCTPETSGNALTPTSLPAQQQANSAQLSLASEAVSICSNFMPDTDAVQNALRQRGYAKLRQEGPIAIYDLGAGETVAIVSTAPRRLEKICGVQAMGLTPTQGMQLIQPWVARINGIANSQLGRGIAGAWRGRLGDDLTFIAVNANSEIRDIEGAWLRMLVVDR